MKPMNEEEMREAIYKHERKLQLLQKRIESNGSISPGNKELIMQFWEDADARGLSKSRQEIILQSLLRFSAVSLVDWDKAEKKDIVHVMAELRKQKLAETTLATMIAVLKSFWRWMLELESSDKLPDAVRWLKYGDVLKNSKLTKKDLLTTEEITKMIDSTTDLMQKALISSHYEASNRCGETLSAKINSVTFHEDYAMYNVEFGKTGKGEKVILQSYDLLRSWIEAHPFRNNPNHPLWIVTTHQKSRSGEDLYGKPISLTYMLKIIKMAAKRAGIKKRVYSYLCRHSSGTKYYAELGEALAKKQMLHAPDSKMAKVYNHLASEDLVEGRKKASGMETKKDKENTGVCWKCRHPNGFGARICSKCAAPLDMQAVAEKKQAEAKNAENIAKVEALLKPEVIEAIITQKLDAVKKEWLAQKGA